MFVKELVLEDGRTMLSAADIQWDGKMFLKATFCCEKSFYESSIDIKLMKKMAVGARMDLELYKQEVKNAFTATLKDNHSNDYVFSLGTGDQKKTLTCKKCIANEELKLQLGAINLIKIDVAKTHYQTFYQLFEKVKAFQTEVSEHQRCHANVKNELQIARDELSRLADIKSVIETDLYSKFSLILNEKKDKIRKLKNELQQALSEKQSSSLQKTCLVERIDNSSTDEDSLDDKSHERRIDKLSDLSFADNDDSFTDDIVIRPKSKKIKSTHNSCSTSSNSKNTPLSSDAPLDEQNSSLNEDDLLDDML